jgi:hypothetical protein
MGAGSRNCPGTHAGNEQQLEPRGVVFVLGTPEQLGNHVAADTERWSKVIREAGIKLE